VVKGCVIEIIFYRYLNLKAEICVSRLHKYHLSDWASLVHLSYILDWIFCTNPGFKKFGVYVCSKIVFMTDKC